MKVKLVYNIGISFTWKRKAVNMKVMKTISIFFLLICYICYIYIISFVRFMHVHNHIYIYWFLSEIPTLVRFSWTLEMNLYYGHVAHDIRAWISCAWHTNSCFYLRYAAVREKSKCNGIWLNTGTVSFDE